MAENFLDNIVYAGSTLAVSGDAIGVGSTNAGAKSIIFNTSNTAGHLAWLPTAARTINLPDAGGTVMLTSQAILSVSAGTTRAISGEVVFSNSNSISFGLNGQTVTASFSQTVQTQSNIQAVYDGANSISTGTIRFTNANGVSFSVNGQTISGSVAAQTNQTEGLYALGNTTGQSSSSTFDARTLSISGAGIASVGYSGNALVISVPAGAPSPVNFSAGTTSSNLGSVVFSNSNGVSFGLNGATITASAAGGGGTLSLFALGNTTQNSSTSRDAASISFNAIGGITMGFSNGSIQVSAPPTSSLSATGGVSISTNGSTISIGASNFRTLYSYEPFPFHGTASTVQTMNGVSSGAVSFYPFDLPHYIAAGHLNVIHSVGWLTVGTSRGSQTVTHSWGIYTQGTGTNSTTIGTITSASLSFGVSASNSTYTINQPTTSNATGYGYNTVTFTATLSVAASLVTGLRLVQYQINSTLSPGNYFLGVFNAVSSSSINCGFSGINLLANPIVAALTALAPFGSSTSAFTVGASFALGGNWRVGHGSFTSAAQTNLPASVALSAISQGITAYPYMNFVSTF